MLSFQPLGSQLTTHLQVLGHKDGQGGGGKKKTLQSIRIAFHLSRMIHIAVSCLESWSRT